jgi:hypothetical protein
MKISPLTGVFAILFSVLLVEVSQADEGPKFKVWINAGIGDSADALIAGFVTQALSKIPDVVIVPRDSSDVSIGIVATVDRTRIANPVLWSVDLTLESEIKTMMIPAWLLYNGAPIELVERFRTENSPVHENLGTISYLRKKK